MIEVRGLVKAFGVKPVLRGLDFHVDEGEFVAVVGPNGAGKTTLLRILASLARPTMGAVSIAGLQLPAQSGAARKILGVVSHQPLLYGDLTADQNLRFFGRMYGVPELDDRIPEVLDIVRLSPRRHDLVREYSRGMQQRLAIGREEEPAGNILQILKLEAAVAPCRNLLIYNFLVPVVSQQ